MIMMVNRNESCWDMKTDMKNHIVHRRPPVFCWNIPPWIPAWSFGSSLVQLPLPTWFQIPTSQSLQQWPLQKRAFWTTKSVCAVIRIKNGKAQTSSNKNATKKWKGSKFVTETYLNSRLQAANSSSLRLQQTQDSTTLATHALVRCIENGWLIWPAQLISVGIDVLHQHKKGPGSRHSFYICIYIYIAV